MADGSGFRADGLADDGDRWTVRGVSRHARNVAKSAADAGRQSVGEWLTCVILSADKAEDAAQPARQTPSDGRPNVLADIERLVSAASQLAAAPDVPKGTRAPLNRVIREQAKLLQAPADKHVRHVTSAANPCGRVAGALAHHHEPV